MAIPTGLWKIKIDKPKNTSSQYYNSRKNNQDPKKYIRTEYGSGSEITTTAKITEGEIKSATGALQNRKSVGKNGVTEEAINKIRYGWRQSSW